MPEIQFNYKEVMGQEIQLHFVPESFPGIKKGLKLKVSKSRKQILKFSFEPKNERKYFCISAIASKMGQIIKIMACYHAN